MIVTNPLLHEDNNPFVQGKKEKKKSDFSSFSSSSQRRKKMPTASKTMSSLLGVFLNGMEHKNNSKKTIQNYAHRLQRAIEYF